MTIVYSTELSSNHSKLCRKPEKSESVNNNIIQRNFVWNKKRLFGKVLLTNQTPPSLN